jgi:hypothetical protein
LLKKAYKIGLLCDIDIAICLRYCKSSCLITYRSIDHQCWPPIQEQIVGALDYPLHYTNTLQEHAYPIPLVLLPEDIEARFRKIQDTIVEDRKDVRQSSTKKSYRNVKENTI